MDILKLRWPLAIITTVEVIFLILYALYGFDLKKYLEFVVSGGVELIIGIVGALIGGILLYYWIDNKKKRNIKMGILSEIKVNQTRLQPLFESYNELGAGFKSLKKIELPNELTFESRIYSASLDKLGLLGTEKSNKLVKYCSELKYIEDKYNNLELIHGIDFLKLYYIKTNEALKMTLGRFDYNDKSIIRWDDIEEHLRCAKKAYNLGEELIKVLK